MGSLDRPKLRPLLANRHDHAGTAYAALSDPTGLIPAPILIPLNGFQRIIRHFDGKSSLAEIRSRVFQETGCEMPSGELDRLVCELDRAMVLDGPTFEIVRDRFVRQEVRPAAFAGRSYPAGERALRVLLREYFETPRCGTASPATTPTAKERLKGIISPHIDFQRGGSVYARSYELLADRADVDVFVILGVAHQYCANRFALTRQSFETPFGIARTDRSYVERIADLAGCDCFGDELAHRTEHSIEFQAVFLKYLFGANREISIVPILVGSFHDVMEEGIDPIDRDEIRAFVEALKTAQQESGKRVVYIGSIDLSHVGPEFGDAQPVKVETLQEVRGFDGAMLERAVALDPRGWFQTATAVENRWRVCGLAATYVMLHTIGPARGRLIDYAQAVDERGNCCVTFASMAFESAEDGPRD
jgi:AmmeMemoRadiSam system protein B